MFVCLYECCLKLLQTFLQGSETIARLYADHENGEQYAAVDIEVCSMICGVWCKVCDVWFVISSIVYGVNLI